MSLKNDLTKLLQRVATGAKTFSDTELKLFSDLETKEIREILPLWNEIPLNRQENFLQELYDFYAKDSLVVYENLGLVMMEDKSPSIRAKGLALLGENDNARFGTKVAAIAANDPDETVRVEALTQLGRYVLLDQLESLSGSWDLAKAEAILRAATHDPNGQIARVGLENYAYFENPEVSNLIEKAFDNPEAAWQESAIIAAGRSEDMQWMGNIIAGLSHPNSNVRRSAATALGENGVHASRVQLLEALEEEDDPDVFNSIFWALSMIGGEDVRTTLEAAMADCEDDDQLEFMENAMENLSMIEELGHFDMLGFEPSELDDLTIEDFDLDNELDVLPTDNKKKKK